jgi:hypothetical protein
MNAIKYLKTVIGAVILAVAIAGLLAIGVMNAGATGPGTHETNGTEDYTGLEFCVPITGELCGPEGLGPPVEAPHFETIDEVSNLCIDPPSFVDITFRSSDGQVIVKNYDGEYQFHGVSHTCIPVNPPVCVDDTKDVHIEWWANWNIGAGDSERLVIDIDCTPEPPVPPVEPPVELAPPVVETAIPVEGETPAPAGTLPITGSNTPEMILTGLGLLAVGLAARHFSRSEKRSALEKEA